MAFQRTEPQQWQKGLTASVKISKISRSKSASKPFHPPQCDKSREPVGTFPEAIAAFDMRRLSEDCGKHLPSWQEQKPAVTPEYAAERAKIRREDSGRDGLQRWLVLKPAEIKTDSRRNSLLLKTE